MDIQKEILRIAKTLISKTTPVKVTILPKELGAWTVVMNGKNYNTKNPISMILGEMNYNGTTDALINGNNYFDGEKSKNLESALRKFFDRWDILGEKVRTAGRWANVKAMRKDLEAILDQFDDWLEDEKSAVQDGSAGFDYTPYYREARDNLVKTIEKFTKVEKYV